MTKGILEQVQGVLDKKFGKGTAVRLDGGDSRSEVVEAVPTGIGPVDKYILGVGGFPVGKMVETFGEEGTAKTSLALAACASATKLGGLVVYCDAEHSLQLERARMFGVDFDRFLLLQPDTLEDAIDQMRNAVLAIPNGAGPNVVVLDSIAATTPKAELEGDAGDQMIGLQPRLIGRLCRTMMPLIVKHRVAFILINQTREKVGVMFGNPIVTPGGKAPKFFCAARLQLTQGAKPEKDHRDVRIKSVKNKLTMPHREVIARLDYANGWADDWSTLNHAKDMALVPQNTRVSEKSVAEAREKLGWALVVTR